MVYTRQPDNAAARITTETPIVAQFELTDHTGNTRTQADFAGGWMLVFFGFTNCPDICPTTLSEVAFVMGELGDTGTAVQPVMISVDPERDTPEVLGEYVSWFDAGIIGLTGTPEQVAKSAQSFPVFYERVEQASAPDGYTMAHASQLFLFSPEGALVKFWHYGTSGEQILADLKQEIGA